MMTFTGWERMTIETEHGDVSGIAPIILSASRATDIPAFYPEWFMDRLKSGYVQWTNRFNGKRTYVSFEKGRVFVFWTKDARPIMKYLPVLDDRGLNYYFTCTLNDYEREGFEPNVPGLMERVRTFQGLSEMIGRDRVLWRFDPLLLSDSMTIDRLLDRIYGVGDLIHKFTEKLIISFIDVRAYRRVHLNLKANGFKDSREFTPDDMEKLAGGLREMNKGWNIDIRTCAEEADLSAYGITHNKCIDDDLMIRLFSHDGALMDFLGFTPADERVHPYRETGGKRGLSLKDRGQRKACGCVPSKDIGQYHTCMHLCVYCYANASAAHVRDNYLKHKREKEYGESILSVLAEDDGFARDAI
jgi:hypothetical protein